MTSSTTCAVAPSFTTARAGVRGCRVASSYPTKTSVVATSSSSSSIHPRRGRGRERGGRGARRTCALAPIRALPETSEIAAQGPEGYVTTLEQAYGDEALGNEVRDRMADDRQFSIGIRQVMTDPKYTDRLRAAIDASPYMQAAVGEAGGDPSCSPSVHADES